MWLRRAVINVRQLQAPICTQAVQQRLLLEQYRRHSNERREGGGREGGRKNEKKRWAFISLPFTQHASTCHQLHYTCFSVFSQLNVFPSINANNIPFFIIKLGPVSVCLLLLELFPCKLLLMYGFHTLEHRFTPSLFLSLLCSSFDSAIAFPAFYLRTF